MSGFVRLTARALGAALLFGVACLSAMAAEPVCYEFRAVYTSGGGRQGDWIAGPDAASVGVAVCRSLADNMPGVTQFVGGFQRTIVSITDVGWVPGGSYGSCTWTRVFHDGYTDNIAANVSISRGAEVPCPLSPCEEYKGVRTVLSSPTGTSLPETACHAVAGALCQFELAGVGVVLPGTGGWSAKMAVTGESCSLSDDLGPMGECIVMEGGTYACVDRSSMDSTASASCGEVNGQPVCLDDVPEGACALLADGGLICAATEEPRLDGEGNPVAADARLGFGGSGGDAKEFDYFGPGAAGNVIAGGSVSVVSSPGSVSGIPRPGVVDGLPGPEGDGPGGEDEGEAWDAGEGMAGVISALSSNSWLGVLSSAASALSGSASCPSVMLDFELLGEPLDIFQAACGYMEPYYGMWVAMMQIAWGLLAFRIFWKGVRE